MYKKKNMPYFCRVDDTEIVNRSLSPTLSFLRHNFDWENGDESRSVLNGEDTVSNIPSNFCIINL